MLVCGGGGGRGVVVVAVVGQRWPSEPGTERPRGREGTWGRRAQRRRRDSFGKGDTGDNRTAESMQRQNGARREADFDSKQVHLRGEENKGPLV